MFQWKKHLADERAVELRTKLNLLFDHYQINRSAAKKWRLLAEELAKDFVPGSQIKITPSRGRHRKWNEYTHARLYWEVQKIIDKKEKETGVVISDRNAVQKGGFNRVACP